MTRQAAHPCARPSTLAAVVVVLALSTLPRTAAAHVPFCVEGPNPAGHVPPAGTSTPPGTTTHGPINPDGFFTVGTTNPGGTPADVELFDAGDGCTRGTSGFDFGVFETGTNIKYTEANGIKPHMTPMSGVVDFHLFGQGDLLVCEAGVLTNCVCCPVPPPPF